VFDLWGVILSSLGFVGLCVALAVLLGSLLGAALIARRRRRAPALLVPPGFLAPSTPPAS
jgi:hypothetical protein